MTRFYALMEGPAHWVGVGPFEDYERARDWGSEHETDEWTYRGSIALLSVEEWRHKYGRKRG